MKLGRLRRALQSTWKLEAEGRYSFKIRASSLPMCSRYYALHLLMHNLGGVYPDFPDRFILDVTADAGTNVHTVYQRWLGRLGVLFGHWECKPCGIVHRDRVGPVYCAACKNECVYQELEFLDSMIGYSGHGDGLYPLYFENPLKELYLFDIKTGKSTDLEPQRSEADPETGLAKAFKERVWEKWHWQTSTYIHHLRLQGYNVTGLVFIVVNRDRPWRAKIIPSLDYDPDKYLKLVKQTLRVEDAVRDFVLTRDPSSVMSLKGRCETREDSKECPWGDICFSRQLDRELETVLDENLPAKEVRAELRRQSEADTGHPATTPDIMRRILRWHP